ncbi:MAG: HipA N-terminal domain-containing protein [Bacteroidales bacterium]|nr:HipA N-terminal domain-containing protein [Bacteroidales bacterium]
MIERIKKILWKVEGMEYSDNPEEIVGVFHLMYGKQLVGDLSYKNKEWVFKYSKDFKNNPSVKPIIDFPDLKKKYSNNNLWPFFATRIPTLNQPYHLKKIRKANISKDNSVALLKLFGNETITNPFRLIPE